VGSNDAGNGLEDTIWKHLVGKQSEDPLTEHNRKMLQKMRSRTFRGRNRIRENCIRWKNKIRKHQIQTYEELDILISKYKGQKLTNEQVAKLFPQLVLFLATNYSQRKSQNY
jgi:hypothetical protein